MAWNSLTKDISYGHDYRRKLAVGEKELILAVKQAALAIAEATYSAGIDRKDGGLFSGCSTVGCIHAKKEW
ncbi:MAG: hypothetical protein LBV17_08575 [Treponema sp.]|jgi:hypothetical protein|nr:hypothetical protein [Treponema sp.]